eukprot:3808353-Rhodomonas_salina.2
MSLVMCLNSAYLLNSYMKRLKHDPHDVHALRSHLTRSPSSTHVVLNTQPPASVWHTSVVQPLKPSRSPAEHRLSIIGGMLSRAGSVCWERLAVPLMEGS